MFNTPKITRSVYILFFIGLSSLLFAQSPKAFIKAADEAFGKKDYFSALTYYQEAISLGKKSDDLYFKAAEAAKHYFALDVAEKFYKKVLNKKNFPKREEALFQLATVHQLKGEFQEAITLFEDFKEKYSSHELTSSADKRIKACLYSIELKAEEEDVAVTQLNKRVNTAYSEFAPLRLGDTLYYSSYRFKPGKDAKEPTKMLSKVLFSIKGSKGRSLPRGFNVKNKLNAHIALTPNRQQIYYTECDYDEGGMIRCKIVLREKDKRRRWTKPKVIKGLSHEKFTYTQPAVGYFEGEQVLFYVSNESEEAANDLNIWYVKILAEGKIGEKQRLDIVNTGMDDITPFYHSISGCLYFSSNGRPGIGAHDIYKICKSGEEWGAIEHLGYPINTSYNDLYYTLDEDEKLAYLSSNREGSFYLEKDNKACCNDIYQVKFPCLVCDSIQVAITDSLVVVEEEVDEEPVTEPIVSKPIPTVVTYVPQTLEDFLPLALYFDNDEPDKKTRKSTTQKSYGESYDQYYLQKQNYMDQYSAPFEGEEKIRMENEMADFFENEIKKDNEYLNLFSRILLERLSAGEEIEIFIKGFTSPRAQSDYNIFLGKRRISSVLNHFMRYQNGVFTSYMNQGKLKITEKSFGESTASQTISDALEDTRNSVFSIAAARERRVEIMEIKRSN